MEVEYIKEGRINVKVEGEVYEVELLGMDKENVRYSDQNGYYNKQYY